MKKNISLNKETKVVCPVCGAEFAIGEHEHQVKNATVIGKDSGLGTIELPLAQKKTKAQLKIDQLKARGIDTSKMFAMLDNNGREKIGVTTKKGFEVVEVDANIGRILRGGTINTSHLFKQHVLAQMLRGLTNDKYYVNGRWKKETDRDGYPTLDNGYYCKYIWYDYTWNVLNDELMRQSAMWRHDDTKSFNEDNRWYNKELAMVMADEYYKQLVTLLYDAFKFHKCKGKAYVKYKGADAIGRLFSKKSARGYLYRSEYSEFLVEIRKYISAIGRATNPIQLHHAVEEFCKIRPTLFVPSGELKDKFKPEISKEWINAYKGYGAYFSMQNLILFHDCRIHLDNGDVLGKKSSMELLDSWAIEHENDAYWLIGALKQLLRDNNFDIDAKQKEWASKYK